MMPELDRKRLRHRKEITNWVQGTVNGIVFSARLHWRGYRKKRPSTVRKSGLGMMEAEWLRDGNGSAFSKEKQQKKRNHASSDDFSRSLRRRLG